jgi:predicted Zn-dependent protease
VPLLIGTVVAIAVLWPALYFWHGYQYTITAGAYLDRAAVLEKEEDWGKSSAYLYRYLQVHPNDDAVRLKLAETFDKSASEFDHAGKQRAIELYYRAVGIAPDRIDLRKRLTELLLEMERFGPNAARYSEAIEQAKLLEEADPSDPLAMRAYALANYGLYRKGTRGKDEDEIVRLFRKALVSNPGDIDLSARLAHVYREVLRFPAEEQRIQMANTVIDRMVDSRSNDADVYLARHQYRALHELEDPRTGSQTDIETAVRLAPDDFETLIVAGNALIEKGAKLRQDDPAEGSALLKQAEDRFAHAVEIEPKKYAGYLGLGRAYLIQQKSGLAVATWQNGLKNGERPERGLDGALIQTNALLVDTLTRLNRPNEAESILKELEQDLNRLQSRTTSEEERTRYRSVIDQLKGKYYMARQEWRLAIDHLRQAATAQTGLKPTERELQDQFVNFSMMAACFEQLSEWDRAAESYRDALKRKPNDSRTKIRAGHALTKSGRITAAADLLTDVGVDDELATAAWLPALEARMREQLSLPEEKRNWTEVQKSLSSPPEMVRDGWQLALLRADFLVATRGDAGKPEAVRLLRQAERLNPQSAPLHLKLAPIYERFGHPDDADRALAKFEKMAEKSALVGVAKAQLLELRGQDAQAKALLLSALDSASEREKPTVRYALAQIALRTSDAAGARAQLEKLSEFNPSNTNWIGQLVELAFQQKDYEEVQRREKQLQDIEGKEGTLWRYYRARRLLSQSKSTKDATFAQAVQLQAELESRRPNWAPRHSLKGRIAMAEGNVDDAIAAFQEAIKLGESRIVIYEQLIDLLYRNQQLKEAQEYLALLRDYTPSSSRLTGIEMSIAAQQGEKKRAVELAEKAVAARPDDTMARIRLGNTLLFNDRIEEAGVEFREAAQRAPNDFAAWNGLLSYYLRTRQIDEARKTLENLPASDSNSPGQRSFILAQGYQLLGEIDAATEHYKRARLQEPKSVPILMKSAEFLYRTDIDEAERILVKVRSIDPQNRAAQRMLAQVLIARGGKDRWEEAQRLLAGQTANDSRMLAKSLLQRGGEENRGKARRLLEQLMETPADVLPNDRIMLARIYEMDGHLTQAREQYLSLVSRKDVGTQATGLLVDMLLRNKQTEAATRWLKRLSDDDPDSLRTLSLQTRWLQQNGRVRDIAPRIESVAKKLLDKTTTEDQRLQLYSTIGALYTSVDLHRHAESWYQRLVRSSPKYYDQLVKCLAAQNKFAEAVDLCKQRAIAEESPRSAIVLSSALASAKPTADAFQLAEPVIGAALQKHGDNLDLLFAVAFQRTVEKRYSDAAALYERILKEKPNHVPTLNNLAAVLSEIPNRRGEALRHIDRAIDMAGSQPALLDTKAMIVLKSDPRQAVSLLEDATSTTSPDPRFLFHLALAYHATGQSAQAQESLRKADEGDLDSMDLTQSDQRMLKDLRAAL